MFSTSFAPLFRRTPLSVLKRPPHPYRENKIYVSKGEPPPISWLLLKPDQCPSQCWSLSNLSSSQRLPCGRRLMAVFHHFNALKIQQDGTTLALGSERKQMTAFNTKEYGPELTIGFITSGVTSYDILERREFILPHLTRCLLLA